MLWSRFATFLFTLLWFKCESGYSEDKFGTSGSAKSYIDKSRGSSSVRLLEGLIQRVDKLDTKLDKLISHQDDLIKMWGNTLNDSSAYSSWTETVGCGGAVNAESGYIIGSYTETEASLYSTSSLYSTVSEECVWTINANHRHWIKVSLLGKHSRRSTVAGEMTNCKAYQFHFDFKNGKAATFKLESVVSLREDRTYLISGPIMLLSCVCTTNRGNQKVEFEGIGPKLYQNAHFQVFHAKNLTGTLDIASELDRISSELRNKENAFLFLIIHSVYHPPIHITIYYPKAHELLMSSKRKTPNRLDVMFPNPEFCETEAMSMTFDVLNRNSSVFDCCTTKCFGKRFVLLNETAMVMMNINISATQERTSPSLLQLRWTSINYPRNTIPCGYVSKGLLTGKLSYLDFVGHNKRCVWLITPYPSTHTEVEVTFADVEAGHEDLFIAEISDNGTITKFSITEPKKYIVYSKAFLIFLYLDATFKSRGVSLSWKSFPFDVDTNIFSRDLDESFLYASDSGNATLALNTSGISSRLSVVVITQDDEKDHNVHYSRNLSLAYDISGFGEMLVYHSANASLELTEKISTGAKHDITFVERNYTSYDGVFVIVSRVESNGSVSAEFTWKQGLMTTPLVVTECGEVINAERGRVAVSKLPKNSCRWIINCNCKKINFTLMKNRTQGSLQIQNFDPITGKLGYPPITWTESQIQVNGPLVIFTVTNSNASVESVDIMFEGEGDFVGHIFSQSVPDSDAIQYPPWNTSLTSNDLVVHFNNRLNTEPGWAQFMVFPGEKGGQKYNMTWYKLSPTNASSIPVLDCTIVTGSLEEECTFLERVATTDFHSHNESFRAYMDQPLLIIVKPLGTDSEHEFGFQLNFVTSDYDTCGGVYNTKAGTITHHGGTSEGCFWLIGNTEVPATSITFDINIPDGLISMYDHIKIVPISIDTADVDDAASIRINNSTRVVMNAPLVLMFIKAYYSRRFRFGLNYSMEISENTERYNLAVLYKTRDISEFTIPTRRQKSRLVPNTIVIALIQLRSYRWRRFRIEKQILEMHENCKADILRFFSLNEAAFDLTESYTAVKNYSCEEATTQSSPHYHYDYTAKTTQSDILNEDYEDYQGDEDVVHSRFTINPDSSTTTDHTTTTSYCDPKCFHSPAVPTVFSTASASVLLIYKSTTPVTEERVLLKWDTMY